MSTIHTRKRWQQVVALCAATALAITSFDAAWAQSEPASERIVGITSKSIQGMPDLASGDAAAWDARFPDAGSGNATGAPPARIRGISQQLMESLRSGVVNGMDVASPEAGPMSQKLAARGAKQARLGIPRLTADFGDKLLVRNVGRFVSIVADVTDVAETPGAIRAGTVVTMWMTKDPDVDGPAARPDNSAWRGPNVPRDWKTNELQSDFRGFFKQTKLSRGHVMPSAEATYSRDDQLATFAINDNAFPQAEFSNAGVYRDTEKVFQRLVADGDYEVYNYAGPVWAPVTYTDVDGREVTVTSEVLTHGGKKVAKPAGFFRIGVVVPNKDATGRPLTLGEAMKFARPVSIIAPNVQDPYLMVAGIKPFLTTAAEVQAKVGIELFTHITGGPGADAIRQALLNHRDSGDDLPGEASLPVWKVELLKSLALRSGRIGEMAATKLRTMPHEPRPIKKAPVLTPRTTRGGDFNPTRDRRPNAAAGDRARPPVAGRTRRPASWRR